MSPVHIWLMCISVTAPLPGVRWRRLCQAALQACLSTGTLRGGAEQRAPLQPSCVQECLQGAQLAVWHTAVYVARSCLQDAQLSAGCAAVCRMLSCLQDAQLSVCRLSQCSHGTVWHSALPGTHLCPGAQLCRAQLSQGAQLSQSTQLSVGCTAGSGHTAVCRTHSCLQLQNSSSFVLPEVDSP